MGAPAFRVAILISLLFTLAHVAALPLIMTTDSHLYVMQSEISSIDEFLKEWGSFRYRTPIFPLFLKGGFALLGQTGLSAVALGTLQGYIGVLLLAAAIYKRWGAWPGIIVLALNTVNPILVTYEHFLSTEVGSFILLALLVYLFCSHQSLGSWRLSVAVGLALSAGYYFRPTFQLVYPIAALIVGLSVVYAIRKTELSWRQKLFRRALPCMLLTCLIPIALSLPWNLLANRAESGAFGDYDTRMTTLSAMYSQWLLKQVVFSPDDPLVSDIRQEYEDAIEEELMKPPIGRISTWGIKNHVYPVLGRKVGEKVPDGGLLYFFSIAANNPERYAMGVWRTALQLSGRYGSFSENKLFRQQIILKASEGSTIMKYRRDNVIARKHARQFGYKTGDSLLRAFMERLIPIYDILYPLGVVFALVGLALGFYSRSIELIALTGIPIAFIAAHSILLLSIDRYAAPVQPMFISAVVLVPLIAYKMYSDARKTTPED